jgi:very-short-patch-repair endonuclease
VSIDDLVTRQAGVISLGQAVALGMSARTVQRRVASAAWEALHPQVYLVGGHRLTDEARVRAAALWAGGRPAAITGPAAAFWHGMRDRAPELIEVTVPSAAVALPDGSAFLDRALQRHVRFPALYRSFCRNIGRHGSAEAGRLITAAADRADSAAERLLVRILRDAGVGGWVQQHPFGPHRIDLAFPAAHVAIEVDGWAWHVDIERFRADRRKGNALGRAGWTLLRFTWHDLDGDPAGVLAEIVAVLAMAA